MFLLISHAGKTFAYRSKLPLSSVEKMTQASQSPPTNNLPPSLTGQRSSGQLSLQSTTLSGCQHIQFRHQPASSLTLSSSFFFLFLAFHFSPSFSNIPNFYFFSIFLRIYVRKKQHPLLDAVSFLVQFFLGIFCTKDFMHINIEIVNTQQRKE